MAKTPKSERTRQGIVDSYVDLLGQKDFDKISVSALCTQAGIVRSTFYTYFSDIYEVIQTIEDGLLGDLDTVDKQPELLQRDTRALTEWGFAVLPPKGFVAWFDVCDKNRRALAAMLGSHGDPYFEERLRRQLMRHVSLLMDADGMPNDKYRRGFTESLVEIHLLLTKNWLLHERTSLNRARIVAILNSMRVGGSTEGRYLQDFSWPE